MKIFIDMDGVLTDFVRGVIDYYNLGLEEKDINGWEDIVTKSNMTTKDFWEGLNEQFWQYLEWTKDGKQIWETIKSFNPIILSSPTLAPSSLSGKYKWILKNIPEVKRRFLFGTPKAIVASPLSILIDDHNQNINEWIRAGGIGILYPAYWNTNVCYVDSAFVYFESALLNSIRMVKYHETSTGEFYYH